ncbi:keratin, type II cytoskeletal 8-like [Scyliorhinus torazame]|uniref:keratin, type II cytoskeletal 8-like n=1 Tax=Scyliorhinus torazame TaxID=75743 RepID=UPI003B5AE1F4
MSSQQFIGLSRRSGSGISIGGSGIGGGMSISGGSISGQRRMGSISGQRRMGSSSGQMSVTRVPRAQSLILTQRRSISRPMAMGYGISSGSVAGAGYGSFGTRQIAGPAVDLSVPLPLIDTSFQTVRAQEGEQIMKLNNSFVAFTERVRGLEQINKRLEVKLNLLKEQGDYKSNIDSMFQTYIENLRRQLDTLGEEKQRFGADLLQMQAVVEDFKTKYEDEINKRTEMENEFVLVKKDVDDSYMSKVELEAKLESLTDEIHFLQSVFEEEINELQAQIQNTSVNVQLESVPELNIDALIQDAKLQYAKLATSNREEMEAYKTNKMRELSMSSGQCGDELIQIKNEIKTLTGNIRGLNGEIDGLRNQRVILEGRIKDAEENGELSLKDAKARIMDLQAAINTAQAQLVRQAQEYEALLQIKTSLDIEIATYRSLLEREEERMSSGVKTLSIQQVQSQANVQGFNELSSAIGHSFGGSGGSSGSKRGQAIVKSTVVRQQHTL